MDTCELGLLTNTQKCSHYFITAEVNTAGVTFWTCISCGYHKLERMRGYMGTWVVETIVENG